MYVIYSLSSSPAERWPLNDQAYRVSPAQKTEVSHLALGLFVRSPLEISKTNKKKKEGKNPFYPFLTPPPLPSREYIYTCSHD